MGKNCPPSVGGHILPTIGGHILPTIGGQNLPTTTVRQFYAIELTEAFRSTCSSDMIGIFYFLSLLFQSHLHVGIMYLTFALHLSEIRFVLIYATLVTVA